MARYFVLVAPREMLHGQREVDEPSTGSSCSAARQMLCQPPL